jgi:hypothetical protein
VETGVGIDGSPIPLVVNVMDGAIDRRELIQAAAALFANGGELKGSKYYEQLYAEKMPGLLKSRSCIFGSRLGLGS